jgi:uncharacterized protein (UPF0261 family)
LQAHNRLLTSAVLNADERRQVAETICDKLSTAKGPVAMLLPVGGCNEWDRPGADLHDAEGLDAFLQAVRKNCPGNVTLHEVNAHINDAAFCARALEIFDAWVADGVIAQGT